MSGKCPQLCRGILSNKTMTMPESNPYLRTMPESNKLFLIAFYPRMTLVHMRKMNSTPKLKPSLTITDIHPIT